MASPRGTKRALSEEAPEEPEEEQVSSESESEEEPFADGPAPDLFSPSKEPKLKPTLPQRVAYVDRPIIVAGQLQESATLCSFPHARAGGLPSSASLDSGP